MTVQFRDMFARGAKRLGGKIMHWSSRKNIEGDVGPYWMCHVTASELWLEGEEEEELNQPYHR